MTASPSRSEPAPPRRPLRRFVWLVAALGALAGALLSLWVAPPVRRALFDEWQVLAPRKIGGGKIDAGKVAVVLIDRESLAAVGPWPWPRYYLARLTETIAAQQPKAIGFDMIFAEADRLNPDRFVALYPEIDPQAAAAIGALPSMDASFAQVLGEAPVVLGRLGIDGDGSDPKAVFVDPEVQGRPPRGTPRYTYVLTSITELDDVALGHAMLNGPPDDDGVVRRVPFTVLAGTRPMPGMAAELARIAQDVPQLAWRGDTALLGKQRIPVDNAGQVQLRFGHFPDSARHSAARVLAKAVPADAFRGKIVLIGLGAEGIADLVATPLETEGYGVFVQAQAVEALLSGGWLARPAWLAGSEWAVGLLLVLLVGLAGSLRRRWPWFVAGAVGLLLPPLSWLLFQGGSLLFDPLRPGLIGLSAAVALGTLVALRNRTERRQLAQQLIEQRVTSAVQEGELQAARSIQLGMVPTRDRLAGLDPRMNAAAVLEPAHSVGGDFYDAIRIDPDRLLFFVGDVTGKGVPAALYMALSKTLAKSVLVRERGGLAHAVNTLNLELMRDADDAMGVTMLVVLANCATGELTMVNAGHENPILLKPGRPPRTISMQGGPPFCVVPFSYPEEALFLAPGDALVLLTDGVTEGQDADGALFGLDGVMKTLGQRANNEPEAMVRSLVAAVRLFEHPTEPSDDLTILALSYRGA
ncbi:CHASE2 domain-containing protein [Novosphingobium sp. PS1R-30]|uniref:CHASE2 domain-containing protein n=1 Tax=Novosphingobium anseongense TaxID=3133436 RepID=A0ABU8RV11_9SPHN